MTRLTMAQALIRYLAAQTSEVDGCEVPLFAGVFAIFGHGNVAGAEPQRPAEKTVHICTGAGDSLQLKRVATRPIVTV